MSNGWTYTYDDSEFVDFTTNLSDGLTNINEALFLAARVAFSQEIDSSFNEAKDSFGQSWPPIPQPAPWRKIKTSSDVPLWDTGNLVGSLMSVDALQKRGPNEIIFGTPVEYAIKHELGIGVKKRSFMPISPRAIAHLGEKVAEVLKFKATKGSYPPNTVPDHPITPQTPSAKPKNGGNRGKKSTKRGRK